MVPKSGGKMKGKRWLYWLPAVSWMVFIFLLSAQPYTKQDLRPLLKENIPQSFVKEHLGDVKVKYAGNEISIDTKGVPGFLEFFLRKGAHIFVFMILAMTIQWAIQRTMRIGLRKLFYCLCLDYSLCVSDEWHQYFTPNRSSKVEDIWIDMVGIFIGIMIMFIINLTLHKTKPKGV